MMRTIGSVHIDSSGSWRRTQPDWPITPAILATGMFLFIRFFSLPYPWLIDLMCLLMAYAIAQSGFIGAQSLRVFNHASLRWLGLSVAITLATVSVILLHKLLWPPLTIPHAVWLMPVVVFLFLLATILPSAIQTEIVRKSTEELQLAAAKYAGERQLLEARLAALQGQIEPHFLFNTLATTRALLSRDALLAGQMLQHLIAYLQAAMPDLRAARISVAQELERAQAYLQIMQIRLPERFQFTIESSAEARACQLPPLMLMTLVENAIKHGIEPKIGMSHLHIRTRCDGVYLQIEVEDDGVGFQSEWGNGVGLLNIQERLQTMFGTQAELSLMPGEQGGVLASIRLPQMLESEHA